MSIQLALPPVFSDMECDFNCFIQKAYFTSYFYVTENYGCLLKSQSIKLKGLWAWFNCKWNNLTGKGTSSFGGATEQSTKTPLEERQNILS